MFQSKLKAIKIVTPESLKFLKGKLNEVNHTKCMSGITTLMRCKLIIQDVTHHFKKKCTSNNSVKSLTLLFRRLIVVAAAKNP